MKNQVNIEYAIKKGNVKKVKSALDTGIDINADIRNGWTALLIAVSWGHLDIVKLLIAAGADVKAQTNTGWTATNLALDNLNLDDRQRKDMLTLLQGGTMKIKKDKMFKEKNNDNRND